ncbi:hypothetical protein CA85_52500 [Allorhodopirellula solitaria]|uniref:Uncharacterized protein n=1 Tax=Allorhodopirellula solitaria TaxID=2527987 RepID=A0A5C5WLR2_9BACT|nr:hypothetical protein CA85_52500 [Allorhodopirellula solitaria]
MRLRISAIVLAIVTASHAETQTAGPYFVFPLIKG